MTHSKHYHDMHWLASQYASRPEIVQGAGGNISVKLDGDTMLIKASGREFKDITETGQGLVAVSYKKLQEYLLSDKPPTTTESARLGVVASHTTQKVGNERPSMEVWFHTALDTYVLHTHSVFVNIFACSHGGAEFLHAIARRAGAQSLYVPYYNPGFELGEVLAQEIRRAGKLPQVTFLENHGIIIAAPSAQDAAALHDAIETGIKTTLSIADEGFDMSDLTPAEVADFDSLILFPDQIIYPAHKAIRAAHRFILRHIRKNSLSLRVIGESNVTVVGNMESEKHRKNLQQL